MNCHEIYHAYVNGKWLPTTGELMPIVDSSTEQQVGEVRLASSAEIDLAVNSAHAAQYEWAAKPVEERIAVLRRLADALDKHADEFRRAAIEDIGTPPVDLAAQAEGTTDALRTVANSAQQIVWEEQVANAIVEQRPIGVAAAITPWNYPLLMINTKVAPALVTGNTVVVKYSEMAPQAGALYAEIAESVGMPPGVLNMLPGGPEAGQTLVEHPQVSIVAFTGSTATGRRIMASAANTVKKVHFELGGKNGLLVLPDADMETAVESAVTSTMANNGQLCLATTRLLVHRGQKETAAELAGELASAYKVGDPRDPDVSLGPLVSGAQRDRVREMIMSGLADGARVVTGGAQPPERSDRGYFMQPTVLDAVPRSSQVAQEEIFGPVLTVMAYDDIDDAVDLANDTIYGLWGSVWSSDVTHADNVARRIQTGGIGINDAAWDARVPLGGVRQSGFTREGGLAGLYEYLLPQSRFQPQP